MRHAALVLTTEEKRVLNRLERLRAVMRKSIAAGYVSYDYHWIMASDLLPPLHSKLHIGRSTTGNYCTVVDM